MTRITGHWLHEASTQQVLALLETAGFQALFVGGCVRNALLETDVSDVDLSTDALPEQVIELAKAAGLHAIPTGVDHGTITVVAGGIPHEITTFRKDVETDGRRAVVAYTSRIEEDALRRDFTMNALYADRHGTLIDPLNGLADLRARRVRFIENAEARIREDYLRILRFFRFYAWYGDPLNGLDADGLAACAKLSEGLESLSKERIGAELRKLLAAPDPAPAVASMAAAGCLSRVLPGADPRALPLLVDLEASVGVLPDAVRRLSVLGGKDEAALLRLSKRDARSLQQIRDHVSASQGAAELAYRHGPDMAHDILLARAALMQQPLPAGLEADIAQGAKAKFPVTSADLAGVLSGPALGARMKTLEDAWIASGFSLDRAALLASPDRPTPRA